MFCPNCGTANPDGARFCLKCGQDLSKEAAPIPSSMTTTQTPIAYRRPFSSLLRGRLSKVLERADLLGAVLSLIATVLAALAGIISDALLSSTSLFSPLVLTIAATVLALLITFLTIILVAGGAFRARAAQRELKLKRLLEKERDFFLKINNDTLMLLNKGGRQHAE